ncbi:hypothetical protein, partial [Flavobacterium gilvum]
EFNILLKATSEDASRRDLKQGQLLFESIYQNIILIDAQICGIESAIACKNIKIFGSDEKKMFDQEVILVEYRPDFEQGIRKWENLQNIDYNDYIHNIYPSISKVLEFLGSDFDHEKYRLLTLDMEKENKENKKGNILYLEPGSISKFSNSIKQHIEIVLEYYSKQSFKLTEYIDLFLRLN